MASRINNKFELLAMNKKKAFGVFLTAGYPTIKMSEKIFTELPKLGIDFIEIGMPFSDPMADGPLIQKSSEIAIKNKMNIKKCLNLVNKIRKIDDTIPIILMGYYNPIFIYGKTKFIEECLKKKVDGLIIVDLPLEEDFEFYNEAIQQNLPLIRLITPTTKGARLKKVLKHSSGFVYYVSVAGITGTKSAKIIDVEKQIKKIKKETKLPIIIGFGIKTPNQAVSMAKISDGIVIGSALIEEIEKNKTKHEKFINFKKFVKEVALKF